MFKKAGVQVCKTGGLPVTGYSEQLRQSLSGALFSFKKLSGKNCKNYIIPEIK